MGLGVPFNIASYSLFVMLIANVCGFEVGEFVHCMGDAHIYCDHLDALHDQIKRIPLGFPKLNILGGGKVVRENGMTDDEYTNLVLKKLESFEFSDLELTEYKSCGKLAMKMSA